MNNKLIGTVDVLLLGMHADTLVTTEVEQVEARLDGLVGDKHAGFTRLADSRTPWYTRGTPIRNDRHVSIVSTEELALVATGLGLPAVQPAWLGANLLISGIPELTLLPPNTHLFFAGGAALVVSAENMPCMWPGKVLAAQFVRPELESAFVKAAMHRRGVVASVDKAGTIRIGEQVEVVLPGR